MKHFHSLFSGPALAFAFIGISIPALAADDFQGAAAILEQVESAQSARKPAYPAEQLLRELKAFRLTSASLAPEDAAHQWLAFFDRYLAVSDPDMQTAIRNLDAGAQPLFRSLPGPTAWAALARQADARPAAGDAKHAIIEASLKLVASTLITDPAGQRKALDAFLVAPGSSGLFLGPVSAVDLEDELLEQSDDPARVADAFRDRLALEKRMKPGAGSSSEDAFRIPDLVTLVGEKEAEPLIKEALLLPKVEIRVDGADTEKLASRVALEQAANLSAPPWSLACSLDGGPLFEALEQHFPSEKSGRYNEARGYYLLHLIADHQTARAIAIASDQSTGQSALNLPIDEMDQAGYTQQVHDFVHDLLVAHPGLPLWDDYIQLAAKTGQTSRMLDLMGSIEAKSGLSDAQLKDLRAHYYLALLAADKTDEGVAELRKLIKAAGQGQGAGLLARAWNALSGADPGFGFRKSVALARIGQLLDRKDILEEGIADAERNFQSAPDDRFSYGEGDPVGSLAELLVEIGRAPEAEKILAQYLAYLSPQADEEERIESCLADLVRVYYQAGRADDVLSVLQDLPGWTIRDLSDEIDLDTQGFDTAEYSTHAASNNFYVSYMAAWALEEKGRKEEALKILDALLQRDDTFDPAYALLIKVSGQEAIPRLDLLARRDRFETRPLIWKAQLQLDAGKLDDAEKSARAAIAIDPSDGQQGPGRRMRAYAVLADILDKKGDKEHGQIYRGAVDAIRISEHADRFYEAGLLTRAVRMYEDALTHFSDAYCIQSRLALRLSELGDDAGAEEHYRRAYELMPESFGRVESHCFGCERAFDGSHPQSIAEKVFTQLAATMPDKPQVHYLLGYLCYEEDRYREALPEFQQAVKLDPDYLNAWKKIAELHGRMHLSSGLCNEVALNEIRLDPFQHHGAPDINGATDLANIWNVAAANAAKVPPRPGPLFPLTASAREMRAGPDGAISGDLRVYGDGFDHLGLEPAQVISNNSFINAASEMLSSMRTFNFDPQ
jgi:tetratricopeptide (TPR) repeat protein